MNDHANEVTRIREGSYGWAIQKIAARLNRDMSSRLAGLDLTLDHFAVMMVVLESSGLAQTEIGERIGVPAYGISRAIDKLEADGLLIRQPHPTSRRTHTIHATDKGIEFGPRLFEIIQNVNDTLIEPLDPPEKVLLKAILRKLL